MNLPISKTSRSSVSSNGEQFALRRFRKFPTEEELSLSLFDDSDGASIIRTESEKGVWRVCPVQISIKAAAIWMCFCSLILFPTIIFFATRQNPEGRTVGFLFCAASIVIYPIMLVILGFINKTIGTEDYVRIYEAKSRIELPRIDAAYFLKQVKAVTAIRYDDITRTYVLIEHADLDAEYAYSLYPAFCQGDSWNFKLSRQLAEKISAPCHCFSYTLKQVQELELSLIHI